MLDSIIEIAKHAPTSMSKREWYQEIFKRSEQQRPVGESQAIAFHALHENCEDGQDSLIAHIACSGARLATAREGHEG